jgi:uncharacterized protein (DUF608 family)
LDLNLDFFDHPLGLSLGYYYNDFFIKRLEMMGYQLLAMI